MRDARRNPRPDAVIERTWALKWDELQAAKAGAAKTPGGKKGAGTKGGAKGAKGAGTRSGRQAAAAAAADEEDEDQAEYSDGEEDDLEAECVECECSDDEDGAPPGSLAVAGAELIAPDGDGESAPEVHALWTEARRSASGAM